MKIFSKKLLSGGSIFLASLLISDAINFLFNAYLARTISFENFGLITFINTLLYLFNIFMGSHMTTVNHKTSYLSAKVSKEEGIVFYKAMVKKSLLISLGVSILWIIATPFLSEFFDIDRWVPLLLFAPLIIAGTFTANNKGYLQGSLSFATFGILAVFEALGKLLIAAIFIFLHLPSLVYASIVLAELVDSFNTWLVVRPRIKTEKRHNYKFPVNFFAATLVTRLSTVTFLVLDVILAKHFLSAKVAGEYALLSLVGKMVFFFGSLLNGFIIPLISREEGLSRSTIKTFYRILTGAALLTFTVYAVIGLFGFITMPILFGAKTATILTYLPFYALAIGLFTISNQLVTYHLTKHRYVFPISAFGFSIVVVAGILFFHRSIADFVNIIFLTSIANFIFLFILHFFVENQKFILSNIIDFLEALSPFSKTEEKKGQFRILLFNWRDTKHVYAGGAEVYVHELAKRWVAMGHHVTWFCGNDGNDLRHEIIDGIEITRRGGFYFVYLWAFVYYILRFRGKYDVIIDTQNGIPFFTPLYAKERVYCLMFHVHQDVFQKSLIKPLAMFAAFLENTVMPFVYRNIKFLTISESTRKDMNKLSLGNAGIEIIFPGVDIHHLIPGQKHEKPLVLYLGRLKFYKSVDVFIKAAKEIIKHIPDAQFVIAGDGEERENLKRLAKKLNLSEKIEFWGKVTEEQKIDLYKRAWVFVNPSMMEGWGLTVIEANACGTPVVASDVPGLRDAIRNPHTGYLVEYGNVNLFAEKVVYLIKNKEELRDMSNRAVDWAKKFDWDKSAQESISLLQI